MKHIPVTVFGPTSADSDFDPPTCAIVPFDWPSILALLTCMRALAAALLSNADPEIRQSVRQGLHETDFHELAGGDDVWHAGEAVDVRRSRSKQRDRPKSDQRHHPKKKSEHKKTQHK
eukprot:m.476732 g.476732  ORF g.476732 m.476732 type:complete len:118 (+) comp41697_c0_seq1:1320-1673(+)